MEEEDDGSENNISYNQSHRRNFRAGLNIPHPPRPLQNRTILEHVIVSFGHGELAPRRTLQFSCRGHLLSTAGVMLLMEL